MKEGGIFHNIDIGNLSENDVMFRGSLEPGVFRKLPGRIRDITAPYTGEQIKIINLVLPDGVDNLDDLTNHLRENRILHFPEDREINRRLKKRLNTEIQKAESYEVVIFSQAGLTESMEDLDHRNVCDAAINLGLEKVPAAAGYILLLQGDRVPNTRVYLGMEPWESTDIKIPTIFSLSKRPGLTSIGAPAYDGYKHSPKSRWVFKRPRQ